MSDGDRKVFVTVSGKRFHYRRGCNTAETEVALRDVGSRTACATCSKSKDVGAPPPASGAGSPLGARTSLGPSTPVKAAAAPTPSTATSTAVKTSPWLGGGASGGASGSGGGRPPTASGGLSPVLMRSLGPGPFEAPGPEELVLQDMRKDLLLGIARSLTAVGTDGKAPTSKSSVDDLKCVQPPPTHTPTRPHVFFARDFV
jgi:hypothetical protein